MEELEEKARKVGAGVEEYLLDLLTRDSDPSEAAGKYIEGACGLLKQAKEELGRNDLRQASGKIWGACALAIKAHALHRRGLRLESHKDLWMYKGEVAKELGDRIRIAFKLADSMHKNFYEDLATKEDVIDVLKEVEALLDAVAASLKERG